MKNGFTVFGDMLDSGIKNIVNANNTPYIELGTINSDFSLTTDNYPIPIPKGDYMVNIAFTNNTRIIAKEDGLHNHVVDTYHGKITSSENGIHTHDVKHTLSVGDRVVVARVGTERIVLAIVVSSNEL